MPLNQFNQWVAGPSPPSALPANQPPAPPGYQAEPIVTLARDVWPTYVRGPDFSATPMTPNPTRYASPWAAVRQADQIFGINDPRLNQIPALATTTLQLVTPLASGDSPTIVTSTTLINSPPAN